MLSPRIAVELFVHHQKQISIKAKCCSW